MKRTSLLPLATLLLAALAGVAVPLLMQLVRMGDDALAEFFGRYVTWALEVYVQVKSGALALGQLTPFGGLAGGLGRMMPGFGGFGGMSPPMSPMTPPPPTAPPTTAAAPHADDLAALRRELDALKREVGAGRAKKKR